ncbi:MAG: hypothetical protein R2867_13955 [Caldilineaceae bacterium]
MSVAAHRGNHSWYSIALAGRVAVGLYHVGHQLWQGRQLFMMAAQAAAALGCLPILVLAGQFTAAEEAALHSRLPTETVVTQRVDLHAVCPM